ncbi:MAG TPA: GNAT family N-acetyltransferase [Candidatus Cybelea sp.]|jgi:predicted N-acetyltransferase YhbS|nr:GNAT family N-acetyltransferase [Candidatus Cybelea sp.]
MQLREISSARYVRDILPQTAPLWAGRRTFDEYVAQTLEIARGAYGRRCYRTIGLYDGRACVASFKRYERTIRDGATSLRAIGFGAVFTPPASRGRGYASVMLATALDAARHEGYDLAYLFSDIRPQFYAEIGFTRLPSRRFSLRADLLPSTRLDLARLDDRDWSAVRRLFDRTESRRDLAFVRDAAVWGWVRTRVRRGSEHRNGEETNLVVRRRGRVVAYVLGVRVPERDYYGLDEFGFAGENGAVIPGLLRAAAGDLRRVGGWLPPNGAREALPKLSVGARKNAILMVAPLGREGRAALRRALAERIELGWAMDHV